MSYTVLARKWRPRNFQEMSGQEHVLRALVNALDHDRIHHAFLFTGTRGVGKTTVARILAKCMNCEKGVSSTPCGECSACVEIDEGRFVDLLEVDAASRTKVDDTRELLDNVQYAPTRGRLKIYLIDEVHMLSKHSFNALLKTLEEPPPHVKFLLATTDPQRLPVTVLSRCLQFNLKRLPLSLIEARLAQICAAEKFEHEEETLRLLARAADGSMRDALSLLDQAIAFGAGALKTEDVRAMLGTLEQHHVVSLLRHLAAQDGGTLFAEVAQLDERAPDYGLVLDEMATYVQRAALAQRVPDAIDDSLGDREIVAELAQLIPAEDLQLFYQICLTGRRDLPLAPEPRVGFEMVLLRMLAFSPDAQSAPAPAKAAAARKAAPKAPPASSAPPAAEDTPVKPSENAGGQTWLEIVDALALQGAAHQLAAHCALRRRHADRFVLSLDPSHEYLLRDQLRERLTAALGEFAGRDVAVQIDVEAVAGETVAARDDALEQQRHENARSAIESDPNIRALQEQFGAEIEVGSIKPLD